MANLLKAYQHALKTKPFVMGAVNSAVLFGLGDVIAQQAINKKGIKDHDYKATARMAFYGGCIFGPAAAGWYKFLERYVVAKNQNAQMIARVAVDQLVFAPIGMGVFFSTMAVLEGKAPKDKLNDHYWAGLKANWMVWPAIQVVNFRFVPLDLRLLVVNIISLGWNSYLAYLNTTSVKPEIQAGRLLKEAA